MTKRRLVVVSMSPLLRDMIVALVNNHIASTLVAEFDNCAEAASRVASLTPDFVFVGLCSADPDVLGVALLAQIPTAQVIVISNDARTASIYERRTCRTDLIDVSPQSLGEAIQEDLDVRPDIGGVRHH